MEAASVRKNASNLRMAAIVQSAFLMHFDRTSRELAHSLVDTLFDHIEQIESRPVVDWKTAPELRALLRDTDDPVRTILDHSIQLHHPSYMGHQVCPPFPSAIL